MFDCISSVNGSSTFLILIIIILSVPKCDSSSSCGHIHNISFPFQLIKNKPHHKHCLDEFFSLSCENNQTYISLSSGKYHVRSINYANHSIRLSPVGIDHNTHCSTFLNYSLHRQKLGLFDLFGFYYFKDKWPTMVSFLTCEIPVKSGIPTYVNVSDSCTSLSKSDRFVYALLGNNNTTLGEIEDSCSVKSVDLFTSYSELATIKSNISYKDIHKALAFGFDVSWRFYLCMVCKKRASCLGVAKSLCQESCALDRLIIGLGSVGYAGLLVIIIVVWFLLRICCMPCIFGFLIYTFKRRHLSSFQIIEGFLKGQNNLIPIRYSYWEIKKMTKRFQYKLGEGGFGSVYKGTLRSGSIVAIKMLNKAKSDGQDFMNEVSTLGRIHHVNVVRLIGYCAESSKRALVYDFMPNGSLEKYIFSKEMETPLTNDQIFRISLGVARGIEYLHRGCDMQILHFDIKPHNILLDEDFTPKVSDFGLAKLYPAQDNIVTLTAARGTMGYIAPELFYRNIGGISYKSDVYSFGMMLMEMASNRKNWSSSVSHSSQIYYPSWIYKQLSDGTDVELGNMTNEEAKIVRKMMLVALWCIQMKPSDRPPMHRVVEMLEGDIELIEIPPKPFLFGENMELENNNILNLSGAGVDAITMEFSAR
ncbi:rust resistance kinase Lr10-like [Impatiens glandulifera]|uniref:rust resistance kinase Lr10-like n=1 Tax=Impatiens glandulifera TaxID=253017 RepID=UPI001FB1992F|nr:rust resistance kinase Lr10-like [Impatiens glandulifera]